jgi:hypothetical protein
VNLLFKSQELKPKYVAYQITGGFRLKKMIVERPFTFTAGNLSAFFTGNRLCVCSKSNGKRFPALADSGNWHSATNSFDLQRETFSHSTIS